MIITIQSEVDSLEFDDFMTRNQIKDEKEGLRRMVKYLNNVTAQLVEGFHSKKHCSTALSPRKERGPLDNSPT